jgi:ABC-2 type transport system ATP-binding protein
VALAARLRAAGLEAIADGRAVLVAVADERPYDIVRDAIADLGLALVRMEPRRHRLEDLFRDGPGDEPVDGRVAADGDALTAAAVSAPVSQPSEPPSDGAAR